MLLFKCTCGKACIAQDSAIGQTTVCKYCGAENQVPQTSDEDCILLFRRGDPETGQAFTDVEFQHLMSRQELYSDDLIFQDGEWLPLGRVYDLPPPPAIEIDPAINEITLDFQGLPAVDGYAKVPRKKKRAAKFNTLTPTTASGTPDKPPVQLKKRILSVVKTIVILLFLLFGGIRLGRVLNFVFKRVANIMVVNTFGVPCRFKLMVGGYGWQELAKDTHTTQQDVYVAFSCKKSIVFSDATVDPLTGLPLNENKEAKKSSLEPAKMRIPIKPGYDTVVNPGGRASFGVYDLSALADLSLSSPELKSLSTELAEAKPPVSVLKIIEQIQNQVKDVYKETRHDLFFTSKDYNFDNLGITRNVDFSSSGKKAENAEKAAEKANYSLVYPVARTLNFRNGSILFDPEKLETERSIALVSKEFKPKNGYSVTASAPRLQIKYEKNFLVLQLANLNGSVKGSQNAVYKATWNYTARMNKAGKWTWLWTAKYHKQQAGGKPPEEKTLTIDQNGSEAWPNGK